MASKVVRDRIRDQTDSHEVERSCESTREVLKGSLEVDVELVRVGEHASFALCFERLVAVRSYLLM